MRVLERTAVVFMMLVLGAVAEETVLVPERYEEHLTDENVAKLEAGALVFIKTKEIQGDGDQNTAAHSYVFTIVDRPADTVWDELSNYAARAEYLPRVVSVEKYDEKDGAIGTHITFKAAFRKLEYYAWEKQDRSKYEIAWDLDPEKENDLDVNRGYWYTIPYGDGRCLIVYEVELESSIPLPGPLERYMINRDTPGVLEALKKRVESDGAYKK
jgi:hypothetical protein